MAEIATGQWNVHWPKLKPGRNSHRAGSADTSPAKRERRPAPGEQTSFMTPPFRLPSRIGHRPSGYGTHALQPLVGSLTLASRGPVAVLAERPPPGERPTVLGEGPSGVGGMERPVTPPSHPLLRCARRCQPVSAPPTVAGQRSIRPTTSQPATDSERTSQPTSQPTNEPPNQDPPPPANQPPTANRPANQPTSQPANHTPTNRRPSGQAQIAVP